MSYGKIKADTLVWDNSGSDVETTIQSLTSPDEGTAVKSTGESGGTKFLREDGDGTCSWQPVFDGPTFTGNVTLTGAANNVVWNTANNSLGFTNNAKLRIGTNNDLDLFSDGSDSYISNTTNTDLVIRNLGNAGINIKPQNSYPVTLDFNNNTKLATSAAGIDVTGAINIDGSYQQAFDVITPATSPAIDCSLGNYFTLDLSSTNVSGTWTFTNVPTTKSFAIAIEITTGASTTVAWNSVSVNGGGGANTIKWNGGAAPTLGASKPSVVILTTDDTGASWYGSALVDFATV